MCISNIKIQNILLSLVIFYILWVSLEKDIYSELTNLSSYCPFQVVSAKFLGQDDFLHVALAPRVTEWMCKKSLRRKKSIVQTRIACNFILSKQLLCLYATG